MDVLHNAVSELALKTGVGENEIRLILEQLGINKTLQAAEGTISEKSFGGIRSTDLVAGIKFARVTVHM